MQNVSSIIDYLLSIGETELVSDLIEEGNVYGVCLTGNNVPYFERVNSFGGLTKLISEESVNTFYQI